MDVKYLQNVENILFLNFSATNIEFNIFAAFTIDTIYRITSTLN